VSGVPRAVTERDLEAASARVGQLHGWDFSRVRAVRDEPPWLYEAIAASANPTARMALDIGTGGGEKLSELIDATAWNRVIAVDHSVHMAAVAGARLARRAEVAVGDARALPCAGRAFDLVLERHASVTPAEVVRVLRPGGVFVSQQVGPRNTQSIFDAFGWGSNWDQFANDDPPPTRCVDLAAHFERLGCRIDRVDEYEVGYAFEDLDSLVFFLKAAPMPDEFDPATHVAGVNRLLANNLSERGIETTEHRELLVLTLV
jgi:SAM-dependent methyltransferase